MSGRVRHATTGTHEKFTSQFYNFWAHNGNEDKACQLGQFGWLWSLAIIACVTECPTKHTARAKSPPRNSIKWSITTVSLSVTRPAFRNSTLLDKRSVRWLAASLSCPCHRPLRILIALVHFLLPIKYLNAEAEAQQYRFTSTLLPLAVCQVDWVGQAKSIRSSTFPFCFLLFPRNLWNSATGFRISLTSKWSSEPSNLCLTSLFELRRRWSTTEWTSGKYAPLDEPPNHSSSSWMCAVGPYLPPHEMGTHVEAIRT